MTAYAERIRNLRAKTEKSAGELSELLSMSETEYFDLELHNDELPMGASLDQIRRLASALGVTASALLSEDGLTAAAHRIPYAELVERTRAYLSEAGLSQEQFENRVGWSLDGFFESEQKTLASYNLEFLKALCAGVGLPWLEAVL